MPAEVESERGASPGEVAAVRKLTEGMSFSEAAKALSEVSKKERTKTIAQRLFNRLVEMEAEHGKPGKIVYGTPSPGAAATYAATGEIKGGNHDIIMGQTAGVGSLLHELVHAATVFTMRYRRNTPAVTKALEDLSVLRHAIISRSEADRKSVV